MAYLIIAQIFVCLCLIALVLLQPKGSGFSSSLETGFMARTKRGPERLIFLLTAIFALIFLFLTMANTFLVKK